MDRQKIRNLVICWCIHRLVGCLHLEKCFIRRHIPFCGRFHTGLFYEKKLSVIQANFSVEPPMSSHPLNTLKTLLALSTALFVLWDHCFGLPESAFRQCTIFRRELRLWPCPAVFRPELGCVGLCEYWEPLQAFCGLASTFVLACTWKTA